MLSVAVQKDIAEYQPKVVGKLTSRTLLSLVGALGLSVLAALYIYFVLGLSVGDYMMVIYAVSLPCWCCGFVRPRGMPFERFVPLWLRAELGDDRIPYVPSMRLAGLVGRAGTERKRVYDKRYRKQCGLRGIEAYSPRAGRVL